MNDKAKQRFDRNYKIAAICAVCGAFALTLLYGMSVAQSSHRLAAVTAAFLAAAASFSGGGFIGFLFGIPKTLQTTSGEGAAPQARLHRSWQVNTNLEQISDWLTKIIVGLGLTQLTQLPSQVESTGDYIAAAISPTSSGVAGSLILIVFSILGFVVAYLMAKFDLGRAIDLQDNVITAIANAASKAPGNRDTVEHLVLTLLYAEAPDGFTTAIEAAEAFLNRADHEPSKDDANLHAYLAAAYGQKYKHMRDHEKARDKQLAPIRQQILDHVKLAVEGDPEWKGTLRELANPAVGSPEDDLDGLKDDPELKALVGAV